MIDPDTFTTTMTAISIIAAIIGGVVGAALTVFLTILYGRRTIIREAAAYLDPQSGKQAGR